MKIQAIRLGKTIEIRKLQKAVLFHSVLKDPYVIQFGQNSFAALFKYGVGVFWGLNQDEITKVVEKVKSFINTPSDNSVNEELEVKIGSDEEKILNGHIEITDLSIEKVAVVSEVLSRSVALEYFEQEIEEVLSGFGDIVDSVSKGQRIKFSNRNLLKKVGFAMNMQHLIISQLAMLDKPELTWEFANLDRFYNILSEEFEIEERYSTISKKLEVIFRNIEFIMNFLDTRRGFWMEIIIIALIAVEVVIFVFEKLFY